MTLPVNELVDADRGYINPLIFTDQSVYEQELEQVFGRSWLFLAHSSQLPERGDFIQTYMGEDPVLVVRQKDGTVKAFLNQCRHRGMRICRSDQGTSKTFTCSYHGWAYDLQGNLINVPQEERAYRNEIDKTKWGALKVPWIAEYKGFYFGTWSTDVPDFKDYLGDMAYYFDAVVGRWDNGLELVEGTSKWVIDCNWKFAGEQFASDMYHAEFSHASALIALHEDPAFWAGTSYQTLMPGRQFNGNGHGSGSFWADSIGFSESMYNSPALSEWVTANTGQALRNVSEQQLLKVAGHNTIFPNFSWLAGPATMRVWHPRGPGQIEVWAWTYVPKDAPDEVKAAYRRMTQRTFSPAGSFETDDGENWTEIQQVLRGWKARNSTFNAQMGLGHDERDVHGLPGRTSDALSESAARGFYQRWSDLMAGLSWPDITELDAARRAKEALHQEVQEA